MSDTKNVCRCPSCGSTRAHYDGERSTGRASFMTCPDCGHEGLFDRWEVTRDWFVETDVDLGAPVPTRLPPQSAADRAAREAAARWLLMTHDSYAREDRVVGRFSTEAEAEHAMDLARRRAGAAAMWIVKAGS